MSDLKIIKHLICLSPAAEKDLVFITKELEANHSLAVRQALRFFARHVKEVEDKFSISLDANHE